MSSNMADGNQQKHLLPSFAIVWNLCENRHYESVVFQRATYRAGAVVVSTITSNYVIIRSQARDFFHVSEIGERII